MEPNSLTIAYARVIVSAIAPTENFNTYMEQVKWVATMLEKFQQEAPQRTEANDVVQ